MSDTLLEKRIVWKSSIAVHGNGGRRNMGCSLIPAVISSFHFKLHETFVSFE
jgi:hypothetical protein